MKKSNKRMIAKCLCLLSFISILITVIVVCCLNHTSVVSPEFINVNKVYSGTEKEIISTEYSSSSKYTPISEVAETNISNYQGTGDDKKVISLSTSDDLSLLSTKAYTNSEYLKCNYELLNNITYTSNTYFIPLGWQQNGTTEAFSGSFNGNGYDITNLKFIIINASSKSTYSGNEYFAFVAKNSGTIKNVGLVEPTIAISDLMESLANNGVSNLCGQNSGTIDSCYVRQLNRSIENECGITALGGYRVSGLVVENSGTISNTYLATNSIYNRTCNDMIEFADVALTNTGTITNVHFYNNSIDTSNSTFTKGGNYTFKYKTELGNTRGKSGTNYPGDWVKTLDELREKFTLWTSSVGSAYTYVTPVKRSITLNNNVFSITSVNNLVMLYELINLNAVFASYTYTYSIESDLDLSYISSDVFKYSRGIGATITGENYNSNSSSTLITGEKNTYPTIYNLDITNSSRYVTNLGVDSYGFIPYYTGNMSKLNFYYSSDLNLDNLPSTTNLTAFGAVVGYLENGSINNVNVYANIKSTSSNKLKESLIGGLCGIVGESTLANITTNGSINLANMNSFTKSNTYAQGISVAGVVGFSENTYSSFSSILNAMNVSINAKTAHDYSVAGVLGGGYITNTNKLENKGSITVSSASNYTSLYTSGVIGRLLGLRNQVSELTNQGTITAGLSTSNSYVSGILNADITVSATNSFTRSEFVNNANQCLFYASSLTNRADVVINSSCDKLYYTSGINVLSSNGFISQVSNLYNLAYTELYSENYTTGKYTNGLNAQTIDMSKTPKYAGLVNNIISSDSNSVQGTLDLSSSYNLRDITFTDFSSITTDMYYAAVARGENINYANIYNEGKLTITISNGISTSKTLNVSGVFEELNNGFNARNIFNGANITFTDEATSTLKLNLNIAGIVLNNKSVDNSTSQNPTKSDFDKESIGTLDNAINNGNILVTSTNLDKTMTSASSTTVTTITFPQLSSNTKLEGNINVSGITIKNNGIISNTFNLGDINLEVFAKSSVTYNASGIACELDGQYASIKNCANNGDISVINMANMVTSSTSNQASTYYYEYVSGIVGINNTNTTNVNEAMSFTINYGTIKGYAGYVNPASGNTLHSYVAGILAYGACNIVNVLNYGNIYGSEVVGSIAGKVDFSNTSTDICYLANTINYGNVKLLKHYNVKGTTITNASFTDIDNLDSTYISVGSYTTIDAYNYAYVGAMFGVVDFASGNKAKLNIRYVLNFYQGQSITQTINQLNTATINTSTFITCKDANDTFGGSSIKFAPLSTVSDSAGNIGVFSSDFIFRKAINKDSSAVDYNTYITDKYITDYFSFVVYDKVNTTLLEKIGWRNVAYLTAAEELARNVNAMTKFVSNGGYSKTDISNINTSFSSDTWTTNIDSTLLNNAIVEILGNSELTDKYQDIINYFLFDSTYTSSIHQSIKNNIISSIITCLDNDNTNYTTLIQKLLYDEVLAKIVAGDDADYTEVQTQINSLLDNISKTELRTIITNYLNNINSDSTILDNLFDNDSNNYYTLAKYNLVNTILEGYSDETISLLTDTIMGSDSTSKNALKYYEYLKNNDSVSKELYTNILSSNSSSNELETLLNKAFKSYSAEVTTSLDSASTSATDNFTTTSGSTYINGTSVSYTKDYTELWNIVKNYDNFKDYLTNNSGLFNTVTDPTSGYDYKAVIAQATEYNSTYQTQNIPSTGTTSGIFRSSNNTNGMERYIYMPDDLVNASTYYYGPFNQNGVLLNVANSWSDKSTYDADIYNASNVTSNSNFYAPFFMSLDETTRTNYINASNSRSTAKSIGTYYWNDAQSSDNAWNQWVSDYIITNKPDNCNYFLQTTTSTGEYIRNGYDYSSTSGENDKTTKANTTSAHNALSYVTGYGTSQVYTGIWYPVSIWYDTSSSKVIGVYLTAQDNQYFEKNTYKGIFTTQYTYYTIDNLVALDGVRTKGKSENASDTDEIAIISAIMTKVLADTNGNKAVLNALAEYASTESFTSSQQASMMYLASSLKGTTFASKFSSELVALQSDTTLKSLSYPNTSLTNVYLKLEDLIKDQTFTSKQALAFYISNNKTAFIKLLNYGLTDFSDYDNDDGTNTITSSDFTYHLATYISYLKSQNPNITAREIVAIINSAKSTDIEYLQKLDDLTYDSWINNSSITHEGNDYGTSTDIKALGVLSSNNINSNVAYPFKWESDRIVKKSGNKNVTYYGTNKGNVSYITTTVAASTKGNNIGYFIGSDLKIYSDKATDYTKFYYPDKASDSESHELPYTSGTITYEAPDSDIINYLNENGSYLLRMSSQSNITKTPGNGNSPTGKNSYNLIENAQVGKWSGTALVPSRAIWLVPVKVGSLKFVIYNPESTDAAFSIKRLTRTDAGDYSTSFSNYENMVTYSNIKTGKAYYFEYEITQADINNGYEYAIVCESTNTAPYFAYIDLGDSASVASEYPNLSTIESNYDTYYNSGNALSNFANTILAKDMIKVDYKSETLIGTTARIITLNEPTIMLVKTSKTDIPITVSGSTTYKNSSDESVTINKVIINSKKGYTGFYLSGGTYTITATEDTISEILLVNQSSEYTTTTDSNSLLHLKYNGKDILSGISAYTDLQSYKLNVSQSLLETLKVIYPTIKETSGTVTKYSIFDKFNDENKEIIKKLVNADDSSSSGSLGKLINESSSHYQYILDNVTSNEAKLNMLNKIIDIEANDTNNSYPKTQDAIIASFIGQNYLNYSSANSLKSSTLYTLLNTYEGGKYQFITGDTSIDYDKFDAFLIHLGLTSSMSGYGIYALSSSLGKKNGIFIPDNFDLKGMDTYYKKDSRYLVIDESTSSYWRDLTGNTDTTYDVTDTNSVNYKFRNEMKQLKLSISTEILSANITSGTYTIYATDTTIDSTNGIIYYYLPSSYINVLKTQTNASIALTIASSATCNTTSIDFTNGDFNDVGQYVVPNCILVTAEDTTVITNYSIYLVPQEVTINTFTTTTTTIESTGGMIEFTITTNNAPDNFDLTPYLTINGVRLSDSDKKFYLDETLYNNGVVTNNTATLRLYIESGHTGGNIEFKLDVYGSTKSITLNKTKSSSATLSIEFEGNNVSFTNNQATSSIKVGRIYTKEELESLSYLSAYSFADNSTHTTTVTYNNTVLGNGRYQYIVTITVTSEDNSSTIRYSHYLNEMEYFDSTYANIYQDGNIVSDLYTQEFTSGDDTYNNSDSNTTSLTYSSTNNNFAAVSFTRGNEYEYRIKYVLNNFYLLDDNMFSVASASSGCSVITPSAGMTVVVGSNQDLGVYYFNYKYTHSVLFDNNTTITREYIFPTLFIIKKEGEDALLHRLTFLESEEIIGNTATIIQADTRNTSETSKQSSIYVSTTGVQNVDGYETTYANQSSSATHYISVTNTSSDSNNIVYGTLAGGTSTTDFTITDYYAIGTVNEAELSYYSPIFGIDEHAQMYQYTTKRKLEEYGNINKNGSSYSDANILGDHTTANTTYLYVPFEYTKDNETLYKIFYVELDSNFKWTRVYDTTSDPTDTANSIATFVSNDSGITTKEATGSTKASFTYDSVTYTVSSSAGKPEDNMSLYMDYIGSPLAEHFWYVSYMVMSEALVAGDTQSGNVRYYHISIIDSTNNIYFECTLYSTEDLGDEIYMTISENIYSGTIKKSSKQISGHFANKVALTTKKALTLKDGTDEEYLYVYTLRYKLSTLPKGYFSFYLDLENGYSVTTTTSDANQINTSSEPGEAESGTFLPYTSIITRTIKLNFYVNTSNNATQIWGVKQGDIFTYKATYLGKEENNVIS